MVEEDRYCIDISHQIMASEAIFKKESTKKVLKSSYEHIVYMMQSIVKIVIKK